MQRATVDRDAMVLGTRDLEVKLTLAERSQNKHVGDAMSSDVNSRFDLANVKCKAKSGQGDKSAIDAPVPKAVVDHSELTMLKARITKSCVKVEASKQVISNGLEPTGSSTSFDGKAKTKLSNTANNGAKSDLITANHPGRNVSPIQDDKQMKQPGPLDQDPHFFCGRECQSHTSPNIKNLGNKDKAEQKQVPAVIALQVPPPQLIRNTHSEDTCGTGAFQGQHAVSQPILPTQLVERTRQDTSAPGAFLRQGVHLQSSQGLGQEQIGYTNESQGLNISIRMHTDLPLRGPEDEDKTMFTQVDKSALSGCKRGNNDRLDYEEDKATKKMIRDDMESNGGYDKALAKYANLNSRSKSDQDTAKGPEMNMEPIDEKRLMHIASYDLDPRSTYRRRCLSYTSHNGEDADDTDKAEQRESSDAPVPPPQLTRNSNRRQGASFPGAFPSVSSRDFREDDRNDNEALAVSIPIDPENLVQATLVDAGDLPRAELLERRKLGCVPNSKHGKRLCLAAIIALCIVATTAIVCGSRIWMHFDTGEEEELLGPSFHHGHSDLTIMERVLQRDRVVCASYFGDGGEGFDSALCRAIAAMVLDDRDKVEFVSANSQNRFQLLANGTVDMLAMPVTVTMERDVHHTSTNVGLTFSAPFFYSGLGFAGGSQELMDCLDRFDVFTGVCRDIKVCFAEGTTHHQIITNLLPAAEAQIEKSTTSCIELFAKGQVNAVAGEPGNTLSKQRFKEAGYTGRLVYSQNYLSREPTAITSLDQDPEWAKMVIFVMDALLAADSAGLTQDEAQEHNAGSLAIPEWEYADPFIVQRLLKAVAAVGNYGELYNRTIQPSFPRGGLNSLNEKNTTGMLYSLPFGYNNDEFDSTLTPGPKITELKERGTLRCGVHERPGFAEQISGNNRTTWFGMDVELCKSIAASLLRTEVNTLEIISLDPGTGFMALEDGIVDVAAGERVTFANKYHEPTTGSSFQFSPPYFYSSSEGKDDVFALATSQTDAKFSSFVHWTVMALIYAEENRITSEDAHTSMPTVNLFGTDSKQMFIDCVVRVGNYGDIYNRTLGVLGIPRTGRNLLNSPSPKTGFGGQQLALPMR